MPWGLTPGRSAVGPGPPAFLFCPVPAAAPGVHLPTPGRRRSVWGPRAELTCHLADARLPPAGDGVGGQPGSPALFPEPRPSGGIGRGRSGLCSLIPACWAPAPQHVPGAALGSRPDGHRPLLSGIKRVASSATSGRSVCLGAGGRRASPREGFQGEGQQRWGFVGCEDPTAGRGEGRQFQQGRRGGAPQAAGMR